MAATVINYLYEDLPEGHTVLASEWNNAMQQIKDTINAHAVLIDQKSDIPFELNIGTATAPWSGSAGNYQYTIAQSVHNKGLRPQVRTYTAEGTETYDSPNINFDTGDITLYSNANITLKVIIR